MLAKLSTWLIDNKAEFNLPSHAFMNVHGTARKDTYKFIRRCTGFANMQFIFLKVFCLILDSQIILGRILILKTSNESI